VTNALAYFNTASITTVKCILRFAPDGSLLKQYFYQYLEQISYGATTFTITTLSIQTFSISTLFIIIFSITILFIRTFSIRTLRINSFSRMVLILKAYNIKTLIIVVNAR
jgi:hypothetical protein